jgi:hypothetical protein
MSGAERLLPLCLRAAGLPEPIREYRFAPSRRWRFDFAWPAAMLAVEVEGGAGVAQVPHARCVDTLLATRNLCRPDTQLRAHRDGQPGSDFWRTVSPRRRPMRTTRRGELAKGRLTSGIRRAR